MPWLLSPMDREQMSKGTHSRKKECKGGSIDFEKAVAVVASSSDSAHWGVSVRARAPSQLKGPFSLPQEREFLKSR